MPLLRLRRLWPYNGLPECEAPGGHVSGKTFGRSVPRQEDRALLTGKGRFVADIRLDGMLHAAFLRSPHAHAKILSIDAAAARALPGVHAVFTAADIRKHVVT